jgi:hypothetical protein
VIANTSNFRYQQNEQPPFQLTPLNTTSPSHRYEIVPGYAGADPGGRTRRSPPLKLEKISFFGVKSWFFTRNTPKIFAPPSARRNFFKCAPPPNLKSWIRPWYGLVKLQLDLQLPILAVVHMTVMVMRTVPAQGGVYSIKHYLVKFITNLRLVGGCYFLEYSGFSHQ